MTVKTLTCLAVSCTLSLAAAETPNILFIAVDDRKRLLGCYGYDFVKAPHMDEIAKRGCLFRSAYCQQALCGPSRVSIMTGRYPDITGIYSMGGPQTWLRQRHPDILTMPR